MSFTPVNSKVEVIDGTNGDTCLHIFDGLFKKNVYVLYADTDKSIKQLCENLGVDEPKQLDGTEDASCYKIYHKHTRQYAYFICFYKGRTPGLIAHECFHVVEYICNDLGIVHSNKSSETFAYLLTFYVDLVTKFLNSKKQFKYK